MKLFVSQLDACKCAPRALVYLLVAWVGAVDVSSSSADLNRADSAAYSTPGGDAPSFARGHSGRLNRHSPRRIVQCTVESPGAKRITTNIRNEAENSFVGCSVSLPSQPLAAALSTYLAELTDLPALKLRV